VVLEEGGWAVLGGFWNGVGGNGIAFTTWKLSLSCAIAGACIARTAAAATAPNANRRSATLIEASLECGMWPCVFVAYGRTGHHCLICGDIMGQARSLAALARATCSSFRTTARASRAHCQIR